ncbi:MAG: CARDB domain-containing protein [bacterium]
MATTIESYPDITIMEVEGSYDAETADGDFYYEPRQAIAKEFFKTHPDEHDILVVFSNFDFLMLDHEAAAFFTGVRNDVSGIGMEIYDNSQLFGSDGKLQGIIDMGNIENIVSDPLSPGFELTMAVLSHEFLHRWAAHVGFQKEGGPVHTDLIGKADSHWSFLLDTSGSLLYGNRWQDNKDGTFTSLPGFKYYSPLDLYLMGLTDRSGVSPMLLIKNQDIDPGRLPEPEVTIEGTPQYIIIDDIIRVEGERIPGVEESQKDFRFGCILVTRPGTFTGDELFGIRTIMKHWIIWVSGLTGAKALVHFDANPLEDIPANPGTFPIIYEKMEEPSIEDGIAWLMNSQQEDGSWKDTAYTTARDTAEAVATLKDFRIAEQCVSSGIKWLVDASSLNTDYLSRKIEALSLSGHFFASLTEEMCSRQNPDGGWGSNEHYVSNPTDTAFALKALILSGCSAEDIIEPAIEYLKSKQNPDGGWGGNGQGSTILATRNVLSAFNTYRERDALDVTIQNGIAWLIGNQNPDGGFGSSASTVYDTAMLILLLKEFNTSSEITGNALVYLLGLQSKDGSWNKSAYQTALAVRAILRASIDPDLSVHTSDIVFTPASVTSLPMDVTVNVKIWNLGRTGVPEAKVALYDGNILEANKSGEWTITLAGNSSTTLTFAITITDGNSHRFFVVIDPEGLVKESTKSNNMAISVLYPEATYDFHILRISVSPDPIEMFQNTTISVYVSNCGATDAYNVPLRFYADINGETVDMATISVNIPAGASINQEIGWQANIAGNLTLFAQVDPANNFDEIAEGNNDLSIPITVNKATGPNLTISHQDIVFTPDPAFESGSLSIKALIRNEGFAGVNFVDVQFYKGLPGSDGTPLGVQTISALNPGDSAQVSLAWTDITESGERIIHIRVDPEDQIREISEEDNTAFKIVRILSLPDLTISTNSIVFYPAAPRDGDQVSIRVMVQNRGEQDALNIRVSAYDGNILIGSESIHSVFGNSQGIATFSYDTRGKSGAHGIKIMVDPDNLILEQEETNNTASRTLGVQDEGLWLTERYISPNGDGIKDSTMFFFRFEKTETIRIVVINKKEEVIRTFSGSDLENISNGHIKWEGFTDSGMVVADGDYRIQVRNGNDDIIAALPVTVDNNRSPLTDAIGTESLLYTNLTCMLPDFGEWEWSWEWFPDERGIIFHIRDENRKTPEYPVGIYTMTPDGEAILRLDWESEVPDEELYWSPDRSYIIYCQFNRNIWENELWIIKQDGTGRLKIHTEDNDSTLGWDVKDFCKWSPDSKRPAYVTYRYDSDGNYYSKINIIDISGNKTTFPEISGLLHSIHWLNKQKIIIVNFANEIRNYSIRILDVFGTGDPIKVSGDFTPEMPIEFNPRTDLIEIAVNPVGNKFAFIERVGADIYLKVSDDSGSTEVLHQFPSIGWKYDPMFYFSTINDLRWSRNGDKLAFMNHKPREGDPVNKGVCHYDGQLVVVDVITKTKKSFKVTESRVNCAHSNPYVISSGDGDSDYSLYYIGSLSWLDDDMTLTGLDAQGMFFINSENGDRKDLPVKITRNTDARVSPFGRYITYLEPVDPESVCYGRGTRDMWELSSLLNLASDLNVTKNRSEVVLRGTATDLNFATYILEYADTKTPGIWNPVGPPSEVPVVDDFFAIWVPPHKGTFIVRLTVFDLAGNMAWDRKQVSWGLSSGIAGLFKTGDMFSPNSDGIEDTVELHYRVLEPVHLGLYIYDENERLVKTFLMDHPDPGAYHITWDGTDENCTVVPDGPYNMKILDYEFFFIVDNSPPETELYLSEIGFEGCKISAQLLGRAEDDHLKGWIAEYGEGENPREWHEFISGAGPLVNPEGDLSRIYNFKELLEFIVGKKFRITARDFAGNCSTNVTEYQEEILILHSWEIPDAPEDYRWLCIPLQKNSQGEIEAKEAIPLDYAMPGLHHMKGFESIRLPIRSMNVQYLHDTQWIDAPEIMNPPSGVIILEWDNSCLAPEEFDAVRIKAVDVTDRIYYSNSIPIDILLKIYPDCDPSEYYAVQMLTEDLSSLRFLIISEEGDETNPVWKVYKEYNIYLGDEIPAGKIYPFPLPPDLSEGVSYDLKMDAVTVTGKVYQSLAVPYPLDCLSLKLEVEYVEALDCESLAMGRAELSTVIGNFEKYDPDRGGIILKTLSYYLNEPDEPFLLREFDLISVDWKDAKVELDTSIMMEGNYLAKAILEYVSDNGLKYMEADSALVVDRRLPQAAITFPAAGMPVCPVEKGDPEHGSWYGIHAEGLAQDNHQVKSYDLYYGFGQDPAAWHMAETRKGNNDSKDKISGEGPVQGTIGIWDVTGLQGTIYSLMLKVTDMAGNTGCAYTTFTIDRQIDSFPIDSTMPMISLLSPENNEFCGSDRDVVVVTARIEQGNPETWTLRYGPAENPDQWYDLVSINSIPAGQQIYTTGEEIFAWEVGKDNGQPIPDGVYTLSLLVKDLAGREAEAMAWIIIDNTPPVVELTAPGEGSYIKGATDILGTAFDHNLREYIVEISKGDCSNAFKWAPIKTSVVSVADGALAIWKALPADGGYCLRVTATDKVGNFVEERVNLVVDIHPPAAPSLSGEIINRRDARLTWTESTEPDLAGFNVYRNNQKRNTDLLIHANYLDPNLIEGSYSYMVRAVDNAGGESDPSNEITLKIDAAGPEAKILSPKDGSVVRDLVDIKGTAFSENDFRHYQIYIGQGAAPADWTLIQISTLPVSYGTLAQWDTLGFSEGACSIKLEAQALTGAVSLHRVVVSVDNTPPEAPELLSATVFGPDVTLVWQANTSDSDLAGYLLYRNHETANAKGAVTGSLKACLITDSSYDDKDLPDGAFTYYIVAMDEAGNISAPSKSCEVTIDTHAPQAYIVEPEDGDRFENRLIIRVESRDMDITRIQFQYNVNGSIWTDLGAAVASRPFVAYLDPDDLGLVYDDVCQLRAIATDQGGRKDSSPRTIQVFYDNIIPPDSPVGLWAFCHGNIVNLYWTANTEEDFAGYNIYKILKGIRTHIDSAIDPNYQDIISEAGEYAYEVTAFDAFGNESGPSDPALIRIYAPIITQPYTPTAQSHIHVAGSQAAADALVEVSIDTNAGEGLRINAYADAKGHFFFDANLVLGENFITATATDVAGNVSRLSSPVMVVYSEPPEAPAGFAAIVDHLHVTLTWEPNKEANLSGYYLYRDGKKLNSPSQVTSGAASASFNTESSGNAFDSDPTTLWAAYNPGPFIPAWWEIKLVSEVLINRVEIDWGDNFSELFAARDFEILVWSGYAWITLEKVTGNSEKINVFEFKPSYRTNRIRVHITDTSDPRYEKLVQIAEVRIQHENLITREYYTDANLPDGKYNYHVTAVDYYGFESLSSEETGVAVGDAEPPADITIGLPDDMPEETGDESTAGGGDPNLPDLEIISDDIFIYPSMPVSGEDVSISVIVCNQGPAGAENVDADLFIWDSGGKMETVLSETIPYIGPYSFDLLSFNWDTTAKTGENNLIVILDPSDTIKEIFEENNLATKTFYVAGEEGMELATSLYTDQYHIDEDIEIGIEIHNSGMGRDIVLDVQVEDENGAMVSAFDPVCTYLLYASMEDYHLTWNTGLSYAGTYSIRSIVRDGIEVLAEDTVSFDILPVIDVYALVTMDKSRYGPNEDVLVTARIRNNSQNYNIPELNVKIGITDSKNNNLFDEDHYILDLLAGASGRLNTSWNTALYAPGEYVVFLDCLLDDHVISSSSSSFAIDSEAILTGIVIASPPLVHLGNLIYVAYTVSMSGNNSVKDLRVKVNVLDPETLIIMSTDEKVIDLGLNETYTGEFVFSTEGYGLKNYRISLYAEHQGKWKDIASTSCTVKDGTPPLVQIISPVSGSVIDGILDLSVIAKDNASGIKSVEYQLDDGIWQPLPASDSSTGMYAISWTAATEDKGPHTISFRATDRAGNMSGPVCTDILIEFKSLLEKLTGSITAQLNPVYMGQEETFVFSITNGSRKPVIGLLATILVMDPNNQEIKIALEKTIDVPLEATVTDSFDMSTDNLLPQAYVAVLRIALAGEMDSKVLDSTIFEVKPSLEATKVIADPINLLIWVNNEYQRKDDQPGSEFLGFRGKDLSDAEQDHKWVIEREIDFDLLEGILTEAVSSYTFVYLQQDFEKELRNPYYTDMLILGDHRSPGQETSCELREKIHSGTGIISSLWYKDFIVLSDDCQRKNSIFGIKFKGHLSLQDNEVKTMESPITGEGAFKTEGKVKKVEALEGTFVAGQIYGEKPKHVKDKGYPAIVLNEYGLGKTIYLAFDLGLTIDDSNYEQIAELLKNAIIYIHRSEDKSVFHPYHLAPLELRIKSLWGSLDVQATETFPREINIYDPAAAEWITESPWIITMHLNPDETMTVPFYALTPDVPGSYVLDTEIGFMSNGAYVFFRDLDSEILIDTDTAILIADIVTRLNSFSLNQKEMKKIKQVVNFLDNIQERDILTKKDISRNIHDTLRSIDALNMIDGVDTIEIRLMIDKLLRIEQGMYYFFGLSK